MMRHGSIGCMLLAATVLSGCTAPRGGEGNDSIVRTEASTTAIIESSEPWRYGSVPGQIIRTDHYRIYTTEKSDVLTRRLATFLETALERYRTAFTDLPAPAQRLDTYLMDNRSQWERVSKQLMGDASDQVIRIRRGGYASRGIGVYYDLGLFDTFAIASHEGWHQYTQRITMDRDGIPLPIWLEEGIATWMEGFRWEQDRPAFNPWINVERFDQLRRAHRAGRLVPLEDLLHKRPQDFLDSTGEGMLDYYAQLWALVHFLNEGDEGRHSEGLRRVLRESMDGSMHRTLLNSAPQNELLRATLTRTGTLVFEVYFDEDLEGVNTRYQAFIAALARPGSREAIVAGRSPQE